MKSDHYIHEEWQIFIENCQCFIQLVLLYVQKSQSCTYEPRHDKTNKVSVRPVKIQISLGIHLG